MQKRISPAFVPKHVAIVMDGNGRWARKRFMPRLAGHRQGIEALKRCITACADRNIQALTVFAFSTENWNRPEDEVTGLMSLFGKTLTRSLPKLHAEGVSLHFIGERSKIPGTIWDKLEAAERMTKDNRRITLNICFNYGGRWDIVQAAAALASSGKDVTEESLSAAMALHHVPDPDLVIRTGGEYRISNFLLWQSAYSEFHFTETLWPDFDEVALDRALEDFAGRERRFGQTSEQVQQGDAC